MGIQRREVVPHSRFWLGEKTLEVCSKVMLKDLIVRDLKEQRAVCFTEASIHPAQKQDQKTEWELLLLLVIQTAVGESEHTDDVTV